MITIVGLIIGVLLLVLMIQKRNEVKVAGDFAIQEIINSYHQENDKTYWNYYGQGSRQKVLAREENLIVVNFQNQDKLLAQSLKKEA